MQVTIDASKVRTVVKELKALEGNAISQLRKSLKTAINPFAAKVQTSIPSSPPLKNMNHGGRSRWDKTKYIVSFTPGTYFKERNTHPLITLKYSGKSGVGYDYAELAGASNLKPRPQSRRFTRRGQQKETRYRYAGQGKHFIDALNRKYPSRYKAGRFTFRAFKKMEPAIQQVAFGILSMYAKQVNKRID